MKAEQTSVLLVLEGKKQFSVPLYQRAYKWTGDECRQLWHDLLRLMRHPEVPSHFLGSVVLIQDGTNSASSGQRFMVIDGQQRLTSLTLLLIALRDHLKDQSGPSALSAEQLEEYLLNRFLRDEGRFKLRLTRADHDTLSRLLEGKSAQPGASARVLENYAFFRSCLLENYSPEAVFEAFGKLEAVLITLEHGRDNPQLIFESLNSTGKDLSQSDLVRNFVLMGLEPSVQANFYTEHWFPMESRLELAEGTFDRFLRDYLALRGSSGEPVRLDAVYAAFKRHVQLQGSGSRIELEALVANLALLSTHYAVLLNPTQEPDLEVRRALLDLGALKLEVVRPFLLHLYAAWKAGRLERAALLGALRLTESYLYRRQMCGVATQGLNKLFAGLARRLDTKALLVSLGDELYRLSGSLRFPHDTEFQTALESVSLYSHKLCKYTLERLENSGHKEYLDTAPFTLEHVLPQNPQLSPEWRVMLGPDWQAVQEKYLHRLGNLTLTGYNSELSDHSFLEKRDRVGGFRDSHLRLNKTLAALERFGALELEQRGEALAQRALDVWPVARPSSALLSSLSAAKVPLVPLEHAEISAEMQPLWAHVEGVLGLLGNFEVRPQRLHLR